MKTNIRFKGKKMIEGSEFRVFTLLINNKLMYLFTLKLINVK